MREEDYSQRQQPRNHRSFFFPLILILVGIFFLLSNLGVLSGNIWSILIRFWPVLFLIGAVEDLLNTRWVSAVFNTGIGSVLLLANLGYFPWTTWEMIFRLWPIFLIAIGLEIVFRDQSVVGSLIGVSIAVLIVGALVWFGLQSPLVGDGVVFDLAYSHETIQNGAIRLDPSVADLNLTGNVSKDEFVSGFVTIAEQEEFVEDYFEEDGTGHLNLSSSGVVVLPSRSYRDGFLWDLALINSIPLSIEIDQGVGQQTLDLDSLVIDSFNSDLGVGKMTVTLPDEKNYSGSLVCGIGEMVVYIPQGSSVEFVLDTAITSINYPSDFIKDGDVIKSSGTKNQSPVNTVYIELPIGTLRIIEK